MKILCTKTNNFLYFSTLSKLHHLKMTLNTNGTFSPIKDWYLTRRNMIFIISFWWNSFLHLCTSVINRANISTHVQCWTWMTTLPSLSGRATAAGCLLRWTVGSWWRWCTLMTRTRSCCATHSLQTPRPSVSILTQVSTSRQHTRFQNVYHLHTRTSSKVEQSARKKGHVDWVADTVRYLK